MKKRVKAVVVSALAGVAFTGFGVYFDLFSAQERLLYDQRQRVIRGNAIAPENIAIVMLDETSLAALKSDLGRFPWPRWI